MKNYLILLVLAIMATFTASAQNLKGTVYESDGSTRLPEVFVHNLTNKKMTLTDKNGKFEIEAVPGHLLVFSSPSYASDTVYITNLIPMKVRLEPQGIRLGTVNISSTRSTFNPRTEYPQVYEKAKVYVFSPSTWFSREGRNARRLKRFFEREEKERAIDAAFTVKRVTTVVPLKGQELEDFMTLYRPSYEFVKNNNDDGAMLLYINDSYKKFKALPPEKRKVQKLDE